MTARSAVRIGALVPLTPPGWVEAGRQLLAGLELAANEVNDGGGIGGQPVELVVRDTAADPERAAAAVEELAGLGVVALAGEFHSVVARAAAAKADALRMPFLCSSAVLDALTDQPTDWVARIAPPQSRGWRIYADFLRAAGHRRVAVTAQPSVYWARGTSILREHLDEVIEVDPTTARQVLVDSGATALILLVGIPEPAAEIIQAVRGDQRLDDVLLGAPAGQPELEGWPAVPFLRYLPERLTPRGVRVREQLAGEPSFVAYEGYDTIAVLAEKLRTGATWPDLTVEGTRGTITFERTPGITVWQWTGPPIQVVDRDPAAPDSFRVLHQG
jgi:hypothetical protein